jgi:hypothetical protein
MVDCWTIFADEANENKYCFIIEPTTMKQGQKVTKESLIEGFNKLKEDCGEDCQEKIDDLLGVGLNLENINWDDGLVITKDSKNVIVCADNNNLNEVHITTIGSGHCTPSAEETAAKVKQIYIEGFALPQIIATSSNPFTYVVEEWLNAYGDPEYILFYEKFPEEEAQYWHASAYRVAFFTIVATEAVFLGFDLITWGLASAYTKTIGKTVVGTTITATKSAIEGAGKRVLGAFGRALRAVFGRPFKWLLRRRLTREAIEEASEGIVRKALRRVLPGQTLGQLDDDAYKFLAKKYTQAFEALGEEAFEGTTGRITEQGLKQLDNNFKVFVKESAGEFLETSGEKLERSFLKRTLGDQLDDTLEVLGRELTQSTQAASYRAIPRATIRVYRAAQRARNILTMAVSADLPDGAQKEAVLKLMEEGTEGLKAFKAYELRTIAANMDEVVAKGVISDEAGE